MNVLLENHIIQDQFYDVEKLIYYTIHKFRAKYGGNFYDLLEQAGLAFVMAYRRYDPKHGTSFATYVRFVLWHVLLDYRRKESKLHARVIFMELDPDLHEDKEFHLFVLLEDLSKDAQKIVKLVLRTPPGLRKDIVGKKPATIRQVLRRYLYSLGWTKNRITESFLEIRKVLQ